MNTATAKVVLSCSSAAPDDRRHAVALAERLQCPFVEPETVFDAADLVLVWTGDRLELRDREGGNRRGVAAGFAALDVRRGSRNLSKKQPLARAIGRHARTVIDATAGLGHDAVLLACLGYEVTAIERNDAVAALLEDGLRRARDLPDLREVMGGRVHVRVGDARRIIPALDPPADVIYIDPMFPPRRKASALAKKSIRLVRQLVGVDRDAADLVAVARRHARQRVVVKRPPEAAVLAGPPEHSHGGKMVRYDVYLPRRD